MEKLRCPKCGSENLHMMSNVSGGGYDFGNACCGSVCLGLGPVGLLCGLCGTGVKTTNKWVCQGCGHEFSNETAVADRKEREAERVRQEIDARHKAEEYQSNCKRRVDLLEQYHDREVIEQQTANASDVYTRACENLAQYIQDSNDEQLNSKYTHYLNPTEGTSKWMILAIIIAAVGFMILSSDTDYGAADSGFMLMGVAVIACFIIAIICACTFFSRRNKEKATDDFLSYLESNHPQGVPLYKEMTEAKTKFDKWAEMNNVFKSCDEYEQSIDNQEKDE